MINRYRGICNSCQKKFIFRVVVPLATTDGLRFCCPECGIELSSKLKLDYSVPKMNIYPRGFTLETEFDSSIEHIVTIATDLPVHRTRHAYSLPDGGSPFIWLQNEMGSKSFIAWKEKVDGLQALRHNEFQKIQELIDFGRAGNWEMVRNCLQALLKEKMAEKDHNTIYACYRTMSIMYAPLISKTEMSELLMEYYVFLNDCLTNKNSEYKNLLNEWSNKTLYSRFRSKVLSTYMRVFSHFDAFIVGLLYNEMPKNLKMQIDDYRIFRDDYSVVKGLYQDIFELTSQLLIFLRSTINLSKRSEPWNYVTGVRSFKAFSNKRAFERFEILSELPKLSGLVGGVSRQMRNSIGHFNAEYKPCTGNLLYDDGKQVNYIVFLGEFFAAVKALWFSLIFIEKSDLDMTRFSIKIPTS